MELLSDLNLISDSDHLPRLIPPTVCVQHYMSLRLALRRSLSLLYLLCHIMFLSSFQIDSSSQATVGRRGFQHQWLQAMGRVCGRLVDKPARTLERGR